MENVAEFEKWLAQMLKDAKEKLEITDSTIGYILLEESRKYLYKTTAKKLAEEIRYDYT